MAGGRRVTLSSRVTPSAAEVTTHAGRPKHHGSHTKLIHYPDAPHETRNVDAIIVPTARNVAMLRPALRIAKELGCPLVALCSRWSSADAARVEARAIGAHLIAADVDE